MFGRVLDKPMPKSYGVFLTLNTQYFKYLEDTDVFKTPSGRLKKVTTSCDKTRRRHDVWKKTSDLRPLEDV